MEVTAPMGLRYEPPDNLTVAELRHLAAMLQNRLEYISCGLCTGEAPQHYRLADFPLHHQKEAAFLQTLAGKLLTLSDPPARAPEPCHD